MMTKRQSRADRWRDAADELRQSVDELEGALTKAQAAAADLADVQAEYQEWKDNLPDSLAASPVGEKLEVVCGLDTDPGDDFEALRSLADEAENVDLPMGWGRD